MTKREQTQIIKANHRQFYLDTWARQKAQGISLSDFCRSYGVSRKSFYRRLNLDGSRTAVCGAGTRAGRRPAPSFGAPAMSNNLFRASGAGFRPATTACRDEMSGRVSIKL
jgi:hypothetical protein